MTRVQLKSKARSQISGNILVLFICQFVVYIISNLDFVAELAVRAFYYPTQLGGMWQFFVDPEAKHVLTALKKIIGTGYMIRYGSTYFSNLTDFILTQPTYSTGISMLILFLSALSFIFAPAFILGISGLYLKLAKGEKPSVDKFLDGVTSVFKAFCLQILIFVFTFLWSLLFIIPGIIKNISYSMSFYILSENPNMTAQEALNESKRIMDGHKMDYFILMFSFIWWYVLEGITFGIASIYVRPYINSASSNFYKDIKNSSNDNHYSDDEIPNLEIQEDYADGFEE
jgi:uncharacterized membrane protein